MITGKDLQNRQAQGAEPAPALANGHGASLAARLAIAKALKPPATRLYCRDCWKLGRDAAVAILEGAHGS
jgi:hypothetical protein